MWKPFSRVVGMPALIRVGFQTKRLNSVRLTRLCSLVVKISSAGCGGPSGILQGNVIPTGGKAGW